MTVETYSARPKAAAHRNFPARLLLALCLVSSTGCATASNRSRLLTQSSEVKIDGTDYIIIREDEVLAIVA